MSAIKPYGDKILVKRVCQEEKTAGGIFLPDAAKKKPMYGKVISVGQGTRDIASCKWCPIDCINDGDTVIFTQYSGTEFKHEGEDYLILSERDVIGKIV